MAAALLRALLDVNVLIALLDQAHIQHRSARDWLTENVDAGWASCAITQNGCIRIMSQPGYPNALSTAQVTQRLAQATATAHHRFVPDDIALTDSKRFDPSRLLGPKQVTDAYLLGLAIEHGMRFVTFDGSVARGAVRHFRAGSLVTL